MPQIELLSQETIDKIAAGEVVERPSSVVKELVENAIDAGASAITVEAKEGGIAFIRITDNGCGIAKEQIPLAFLRHSTSKIHSVEDLLTVHSLGFRGEALSSIAAVSQLELITKTPEEFTGTRYVIEGSREVSCEEIGAPDGTTFLVRNLFYNTPARRKFLKTPQTEGGYIQDLMQRMILSHPDIAFKFILNGQVRLQSSGNSNIKDIIYHIYGRDITRELLSISAENEYFSVSGYIGKPQISRGNRSFETFFINGRYIKSSLLTGAVEEAYKAFLMQHQYPFVVLYFQIDSGSLDVNVHPTKMELRISNQKQVYDALVSLLYDRLSHKELVPQVPVTEEKQKPVLPKVGRTRPEPFEKKRLDEIRRAVHKDSPYTPQYTYRTAQPDKGQTADKEQTNKKQTDMVQTVGKLPANDEQISYEKHTGHVPPIDETVQQPMQNGMQTADAVVKEEITYEQTAFLDKKSVVRHNIIGQVFDTYWLVEFDQKLYIIDQHAAHEKVLYERMKKQLAQKEYTSQRISPPIVLTLSLLEEETLQRFLPQLQQFGYDIEHFGGSEYMVSAVPGNMFKLDERELLIQLLDSLERVPGQENDFILDKIATMSCKAAVKGNQRLSFAEAKELIDELLTLENPYHCPHGRPTIISMTKYELEKKFKRIV